MAWLVELLGWLKTLALPFAYWLGTLEGKRDAAAEQNAENSELHQAYSKIEMEGIDDETVDKRLDEGTI